MEIFDVSVPVRPGMVTYPGDPPVVLERVRSIADGTGYNLSRLDLELHTGTHVDAPLHFVDGGAAADSLALEVLIGPAVVLGVAPAGPAIGARDLDGLPDGAERVLLRTSNSELWAQESFSAEFVSLDARGARALFDRGVRLVGIDYLSIGDEEAHRVLLEAGVVALEGLDLRAVEPGEYQLVCAPLKLVGAEGAPARALLIRDAV